MQYKNGDTIYVRKKALDLSRSNKKFFSALGVKSYPGQTVKTTI
jgi:hypothetical protein